MPFSSIIKLPSIDNTSSATHTHQKSIFQHFFVGISPSYLSQSPLLEYICQKYKGRPYKRYEKQNTKKDYSILDKSSEMVPHVHKMIINFLVLIHLFCSSSSKPFCMEFTSEEVLLKLKNFRFKCEASIFFEHWVSKKCFFVNWVCFKQRQENSLLNIDSLQYCSLQNI